ncbi:MAG: hypothetical protein KatS3mg105_1432 [Gemmatales bacterium]|nr:MAG: hypothetical protein KatS3mg105_1432 [Gemmatales bacterium]
MSQAEVADRTDVPNIANNLWWDDVRIGFKVVHCAVLTILAGHLLALFHPIYYLGMLIFVAGYLALLLGLDIMRSIPQETGQGFFALAALAATALGYAVVVLNNVFGVAIPSPTVFATSLALVGNLCYALLMKGAMEYLRDQRAALFAKYYLLVSVLYAVFALIAVTGGSPAFDALVAVATFVLGLALAQVSKMASQSIARAQQAPAEKQVEEPKEQEVAEKTEQEATKEEVPAAEGETKETPAASAVFSSDELAGMHGDDVYAGRAIAGLMLAVFLIGVFLYTIIALTVA